jgi:hypothetical protein
MGKVIKFNARKRVRKGKPVLGRWKTGKVIEFHKEKSIDRSENIESRKPDARIAQALFFWSFC